MTKLADLKKEIRSYSDPSKAKVFMRFFKTGKGEYGEGDKFLGLTLPQVRTVVKKYKDLITLEELDKLIQSEYHEERTVTVAILVEKFKRAGKRKSSGSVYSIIPSKSDYKSTLGKNEEEERKKIYDFYLSHTKFINNWDLVDISVHKIIGAYLFDKPREILYKLARSEDLWERRMSIMATFCFIYQNDFEDTFKIARILLQDKHDLIHKATGWMLREVGKRDIEKLYRFLDKYYKQMPRTCLRYAIEKFDKDKRNYYMKK